VVLVSGPHGGESVKAHGNEGTEIKERDITFSSNKCTSKGMHRNRETTSKIKVKWLTLLFHIQ